jgi:hypothetical protein
MVGGAEGFVAVWYADLNGSIETGWLTRLNGSIQVG